MVWWLQVGEKRWEWDLCLMGTEVQFGKMKSSGN